MNNKNKNILKKWKLKNKVSTNFFKIDDVKTQSFILNLFLTNSNNEILETVNRFIKTKI
tara:strand:- start:6 stop:182 length:177 start_codon:yes stop_codon:yes gene_type:complete